MAFVTKNKHIVTKNRIGFGCVPMSSIIDCIKKVTKRVLWYRAENILICMFQVLFIVDNSSTIHYGSDNYSLVSEPDYCGQEIIAVDALDDTAGNTSIPSVPLPTIAMTITVCWFNQNIFWYLMLPNGEHIIVSALFVCPSVCSTENGQRAI